MDGRRGGGCSGRHPDFLPGVGTTIGGVAGGLVESMGAGAGVSYLTKKALDFVIEGDIQEMLKIIEAVLPELGDE
ncbi:hypothetical protein [Paraburkholderia fungorum]|uniref:hypothetical protein n=1 Tax=Paraburkholderia fungorum TaxID=134537 RepID=UPI003877FA93